MGCHTGSPWSQASWELTAERAWYWSWISVLTPSRKIQGNRSPRDRKMNRNNVAGKVNGERGEDFLRWEGGDSLKPEPITADDDVSVSP